ncbi:hypothetical protein SAMN06297387_12938 [Streptomyces zhaozhouensis]|uniref:Uncharacterized protein n=1 Tax=Streptomyces zhaozhouensis TaxID=1300267 RepID=A0A286E8M6_9ACTN|nr:hypothetical protein SAMN06297387_12938 [Streptomyces zhaozhouensis]
MSSTTSARAESTTTCARYRPPSADHLRSRGEHQLAGQRPVGAGGPPPLARRARPGGHRPRDEHRTTSARAESTIPEALTTITLPDHLRSRGEHAGEVPSVRPAGGPPPLARRARRGCRLVGGPRRTTSARAESTCAASSPTLRAPDHLRSRGEHHHPDLRHPPIPGPPPLARRARDPYLTEGPRCRTTSARAESTSARWAQRTARPDHLRSRGEHTCEDMAASYAVGPPPLARRAQ